MKSPAARPRKCCARGCGKPALFFGPRIGLKKQLCWCSDECGERLAIDALAKKRAQEAKVARAAHRERKKAIQRPRDVRPGTQDDFNIMIRERDFFEPCISCSRYDHEIPEHHTGGKWDCGHFLTRGAHPELAFEPLNAHKQCKHCNRDRSGNATRYEENLIKRIGADKVAWLKGPHEPKKYTVEQLREMAATYRAEKRRMQREREKAVA